MGMIDSASEPLLTAVSKTLFAALNARDVAIAYIHRWPAAAAGRRTRPRAHERRSDRRRLGDDDAELVFHVDDELQQVDGVRATVKLSPGAARMLDLAELQGTKTERTINRFWPPVPVDD